MSLYSADGTINTTVVDGSTFTGLYAADGSMNVVLDDTTYKGVYHPCGAFRVNSGTGSTTYDSSGAYYSNHFFGALLGRAGGSTPVVLSESTFSDSDFVGRTIATYTPKTATLTNDASGQFSASGGQLRLEKTASAGTYTIAFNGQSQNLTCSAYDYGSPIARWNARSLSLLKQDIAKTTAVAADNDPIGSWVDSVSGWELQQSTAGNRPLYKASIQNGLPGVSFDGSNDCMQAVTAALIGFHNTAQRPYTLIVIGNVRNYTNTSMLMGWGGASGATRYFEWKIDNSVASFPGKQSLARGDGTHGIATTAYGVGASGTNTNGPVANTPSIYAMSSDGTVLFGSLNGTASYSPPISATLGNNGALTADTMYFGRQTNTAGNAPAIDVYEILIYDTVLEERHLRAITAKAASDWNLTVTNGRSEIDLTGYTLTASEEWTTGTFAASTTEDYGASSGWTKSYPGSVRNTYGSPGALTGETGWIADDRSGAFAGFSPYSVADSVLTITASQIDSSITAQKFAGSGTITSSTSSTSVTAVGGNFLSLRAGYKLYDNGGTLIGTLASNPASDNAATLTGNAAIAVSGSAWQYGNITGNSTALTGGVTSYNWIERQYGYWEWRGQMPPAIAGMLPAFWLLAADGRWPTEVDAQEMGGSNVGVGVQGRTLVPTIHTDPYWPTGSGSDVAVTPTQTLVDDQTSEMHLFGVDIQPTGISYYYDRKLVGTQGAYQGVTSIAVTNGGSGYTSNPTVVFSGGGGTGASATVTRVGNVITAINVAKTGYGYTSAPTISFTGGGGGTGAAATATIATLPDMPLPQFYHRPLYALANLAITDGTGTAAYAGAVSLGTLPKQLKFDYLRHYSKNLAAPSIITGTQAETTAIVNAMTAAGSTPSAGRQTAINDLVCYLKSPTQLRFDTGTTGGLTDWNNSNLTPWQAFDGLFIHAGHAESAAWINWKNPGTYDLTKNGSPSFTADRGYTFSGANTEYLESTYDLGSAPQLDPWDHAFGVFTLSSPANGSNAPIIGAASTFNMQLASGSFLSVPYGTVSAGTGSRTTTKAPGSGLLTISRGPRYATYMYKNGGTILHAGLVAGGSKPSVLTGSKMRVGAYSGASAVAQTQVAVSFWGRRLMPAELDWINTGFRAYLTSVGAI